MALDQVVPNSVVSTSSELLVPAGTDLVGAVATYSILDATGLLYVSGNVSGIAGVPGVSRTTVVLTSALNIPSTIPPSTASKYLLIWKLTLASGVEFETQEQFTVLPLVTSEYGPTSSIEMFDIATSITMSMLTPAKPVGLKVTVNDQNTVLFTTSTFTSTHVDAGYLSTFTLPLSTAGLRPSLAQLSVVWSYKDPINGPSVESGNLYLVTPSMLTVMSDLRALVNKAKLELQDDDPRVFNPTDLLTYVRQGGDYFNGFGAPSNFDFTNATGPLRYFWLMCAGVVALRAQALYEGIRAFNYSGQAIQLQVDRSLHYNAMADRFEQDLAAHLTPFKTILAKRGAVGGDGNINPTMLAKGAIGCVGLALSPVSNLGLGGYGGFGLNRGGPGYF